MVDIEEVTQSLIQGRKERQLNIPWWNIVRKAEYHWRREDFFSYNIIDPDIWVFEESRKEYFSVIFLLSFALLASLIPLLLIFLALIHESLIVLTGGIMILITISMLLYILWTSFFYRLFSSLSHKKIILNRKTKLLILEYRPWLLKYSQIEIPLSSLKITIRKEFASDRTVLHYVHGEAESISFQFYRSIDRQRVEPFYNKLNSFLQSSPSNSL